MPIPKNTNGERCPICKSRHTKKKARRVNADGTILQRHVCNKCNNRFTKGKIGVQHSPRKSFRITIPNDTIIKILLLRREGKSFREIAREIKTISRSTINTVVNRYGEPLATKTKKPGRPKMSRVQ